MVLVLRIIYSPKDEAAVELRHFLLSMPPSVEKLDLYLPQKKRIISGNLKDF